MALMYYSVILFLVTLANAFQPENPNGAKSSSARSAPPQSQQQEPRNQQQPESRNHQFPAQQSANPANQNPPSPTMFGGFNSPNNNRMNPMNNMFNQRSLPNFPNQAGPPAGFGGPGPAGPQLGLRGLMDPSFMANRPFDLGLAQMQQQSLLAAAQTRQMALEQVLQGRGLGPMRPPNDMGRNIQDPNQAPELAASQTNSVQTYNRQYPMPRLDVPALPAYGPYRPAAGSQYPGPESAVPQYRRPVLPNEVPAPADGQYAAQYPFAASGGQYEPKQIAYTKPLKAVIVISGAYGVNGLVNLSQSSPDHPVEITGRVSDIRPGEHGMHIHALGDLSRSCDSAGTHFNPEGNNHGFPGDMHMKPHAGDLGNILANDYGQADFSVASPLISLYPTSQNFVIGRTLVIHEKPDDLGRGNDQQSRETGNSGARIACGIIGFAN